MAQWYIKEFGQLTGVSVRTLHHYDKIGLFKPSIKLSNGYRLYAQTDLPKLQQIVALKFFGFSLAIIKKIMRAEVNVTEHLAAQNTMLHEQIEHLQQVNETLQSVIAQHKTRKSIQWNNLILLIKEYTMTKELTKSWEAQVYTKEQLQELAQMTSKYTEKEIAAYNKRWQKLQKEVTTNLDKDPTGPVGKKLVTAWFALLNEVYGNYPALKVGMTDAYKNNKIPGAPFDKALYDWIEKAAKAHNMKWVS